MFEIGFSELFLIGLVALVVLGPERLPRAARFAGLWVRRARAQWHSVRSELERELAAEELKRSLRETQAAAQSFEDEVRNAQTDARREFEAMRAQIEQERNATGMDAMDNSISGMETAGHDAATTPPTGTPDERR